MTKEEEKEKAKKIVIVEEVSPEEESPVVEVKDEKETETLNTEEEKPNYLWIIIPTALLVGALVGGLITYFSGISKLDKEATPTPISTEIPIDNETPVPSPVSDLKRDILKIQVLNGSGVSGAAGKAKIYLEGLGYKDVETGNASASGFAETEISIKDSQKDFLDLITTDLSKNYQVSKDIKTSAITSKFDVVITLGQK